MHTEWIFEFGSVKIVQMLLSARRAAWSRTAVLSFADHSRSTIWRRERQTWTSTHHGDAPTMDGCARAIQATDRETAIPMQMQIESNRDKCVPPRLHVACQPEPRPHARTRVSSASRPQGFRQMIWSVGAS